MNYLRTNLSDKDLLVVLSTPLVIVLVNLILSNLLNNTTITALSEVIDGGIYFISILLVILLQDVIYRKLFHDNGTRLLFAIAICFYGSCFYVIHDFFSMSVLFPLLTVSLVGGYMFVHAFLKRMAYIQN